MPLRRAISTVSLGWHSSHSIERKVAAAAQAGFAGVELFITDLIAYADQQGLSRRSAARRIGELCNRAGLQVIGLASLDNFEGEPSPLEHRLALASEFIAYAHALGTGVIQIPSNDSRNAIGRGDVIVEELQALCELGRAQQPSISFAYEAVAWGTHVADWEEALRVVQLVDRPNFGLCLDTYHVLSRIWADPRSRSGVRPGGPAALRQSLDRFVASCPRDKIFYLQLSDAEQMTPPVLPGHPAYDADKDGTYSWCSYGRLFPLESERGAYLPIVYIVRRWLQETGWDGWVSMEVFHRTMTDEAAGPESWAERARVSWAKLERALADVTPSDAV